MVLNRLQTHLQQELQSSLCRYCSQDIPRARGEAPGILCFLKRQGVPDPLSWFNLGVAFEAKGDLKGAESAYRQALLLQPDLDRVSEYLKRVSKN